MQKQLMSSYSQEMFRQCTRLKFYTFEFLCQNLKASLQRKDTHFISTISLETKVVVVLACLGSFYKWLVRCIELLKV
jgi:hypothetical protein